MLIMEMLVDWPTFEDAIAQAPFTMTCNIYDPLSSTNSAIVIPFSIARRGDSLLYPDEDYFELRFVQIKIGVTNVSPTSSSDSQHA
jgi:hypothetical protein